ncbi:hypothetical protein VSU19_22645 [Verrucomicrobiales bacterium BCK34]|nr:hypothetical protein [Verrucomicrobiales bacterium BCK34]
MTSKGSAVLRLASLLRIYSKFSIVSDAGSREDWRVFQVIFNEISAAEISQLPTLEQLEVLSEFQVRPEDLEGIEDHPADAPFGEIQRDGKSLYRYRASDVRIYFEVSDDHQSVIVHRVLSKNTFQDFLYRANLPVEDDEELAGSKQFWELIEEGERARRV